LCYLGKLSDDLYPGTLAEYFPFPNDATVQDLTAANFYMMALTAAGDVYYWGKRQVNVYFTKELSKF